MANNIKLQISLGESSGQAQVSNIQGVELNNLSNQLGETLKPNLFLPNLFTVGAKLEEDYVYGDKSQKYGLRGGLVDVLGKLTNDIVLTVRSTTQAVIDNITIHFDDKNNQWATLYEIDGKINNNDDSELTIKWEEKTIEKNITFKAWNRKDFNAVISHVSFELNEKVFDWSNIQTIDFTDQIRPYQREPFFDVMSSVGTVQLKDSDGELSDYAKDGILKAKSLVELYINGYQANVSLIESWENYNFGNKNITANLSNKLNFLDNLLEPFLLEENLTAYDILQYICVPNLFMTENEFNFALSEIIVVGYGASKTEKTIKTHLESIKIQYAYLEGSTLRDALKKVLTIAMLVMFTTSSGAIMFGCGRPRITSEEKENAIIINPNGQHGYFEENVMPGNGYDNLEYENSNLIISQNVELVNTFNVIVQTDDGVFVGNNTDEYNQQFSSGGLNLRPRPDWEPNFNGFIITNMAVTFTNTTNQIPDLIDDTLQVSIKKIYSSGNSEEYIIPYKEIGNVDEEFVFYEVTNSQISLIFNIQVKWAEEWGGLIVKQKVSSFEINIYKKTYEIEKTIQNKNSNIKIDTSEIFSTTTKIDNKPIGEYISNCIIEDYSTHNGIRTATMTVSGSIDYSDTNGNKVVVWNGDGDKPTILEKGMIVIPLSPNKDSDGNYLPYSVYGDNTTRLWKITGITKRIGGNNRFDLELWEVF